jgi:transposase
MKQGTLIPNTAEVKLVCLRQIAGAIQMELRACRAFSECPGCGGVSTQVHSRYWRTIADLPWQGLPVHILLQTRKFRCGKEHCSRRIYTEPLPGTVARYARRTCRSIDGLNWLTLALGGRSGSRVAGKLGLLASRSTLLRQLDKNISSPEIPAPRVVGIDEWAWKKGHRYGTMICDLEEGRVIDLLPTRDSDAVAGWLRQHPSVQIVSRDRAGGFGAAIAKGAPAAVQVADRWHLLNNLFETLARSLERHRHTMREVRDRLEYPSSLAFRPPTPEPSTTQAVMRKEQSRARRFELYGAMKRLIDSGMSRSDASRQLGIPLRTVQRWQACGVFPERKQRRFPSTVDAFGDYLNKRYSEGCKNATQLWREIKHLGFSGRPGSVWNWIRQRFGCTQIASGLSPASREFLVSPQHVAWLMLKADPLKHRYLHALCAASPQMASIALTARQLFDIIRTRDAAVWPRWLEAAQTSPLASFARRLRRDQDAVDAALRLPWSNGMVEGHIHRLKLLKRQMYGRAGFDLLKLRVLHPA